MIIYSLNGKDYYKKTIICSEDYELEELKQICDISLVQELQKNNTIGNIPVYGGGDITFYTNTKNRDKNTLIISRYALSKCCVRIPTEDFYLNDSGLSIESKDNNIQEIIKFILLSDYFQNYIYTNCVSGSIQKNLNMNLFNNLKIPIPKSRKNSRMG